MKYSLILSSLVLLIQNLTAAPATLVQTVTHNSETITLRLTRENLRGADFALWSQNAAGTYDVVAPVDERSYIGTVDEYPGAISCGILKDDGKFRGAVYFDRGKAWNTLDTAVTGTRGEIYDDFKNYEYPNAPTAGANQAGTTVWGYNVAVDADHDFYTQAGSNMASTLERIEHSFCLMRAIYLRDTLLHPKLGRVIVRSTLARDPYTGLNGLPYLFAVRDHWNANHATAVRALVAGISPTKISGGLGTIGVVGTPDGYSVNQTVLSGEFDVIARHEIGHNWNMEHSVGGSPEGSGIMGGNQAARFSGCELFRIFNHRDSRISMGGILTNVGAFTHADIAPYAAADPVDVILGSTVTIDVLGNDHDANQHTVTITGFDSTSGRFAAPVTLSSGTGPGGRDQLVYGPTPSQGVDYFHYTITDPTGKTATGVVLLNINPAPLSVAVTDADSFVKDSVANGLAQTVVVKRLDDNPANTFNRTGWIHFNTSAMVLDGAAQLSLPVDATSDMFAIGNLYVWGVVDGAPGDHLGTDWTEAGITASNAPKQLPLTEGPGTTLIGQVPSGQPGGVMLIRNAALMNFLKADTNGEVTFILTRDIDNPTLSIRSRENAGGGSKLETFPLTAADTFVRAGENAGINYGANTKFEIKNLGDTNDFTREAFVRFSYTNVTQPLVSAKLKLTLSARDSTAASLRIRLLADPDDAWVETAMTWNTKPEASGAEILVPLSDFTVGVEHAIDVASLLSQAGNTNKIASFHLELTDFPAVAFHSREAGPALAPKLDLRTTDTDHDGMPDTWEEANSLNPLVNESAEDADGDGRSNLHEYLTDTNPQSGSSSQYLTIKPATLGPDFELRFNTSVQRVYTVVYKDDLLPGAWLELGPATAGTGLEMTVPAPASHPQRFYRLGIKLP